MFIREIKKKLEKNGNTYEYIQHRLVESVRIGGKPRQHTLLNLGTLTIPREQHKALANLIEANLTGVYNQSLFQHVDEQLLGTARHFARIIVEKRLQKAESKKEKGTQFVAKEQQEPSYQLVDTNSLTTSCSRTIGAENIALSHLKELDFFRILQECNFTERQQRYAAAQVCARMVHPCSERETARWLRCDSALGELLGIDLSRISDQTLHRIADKLECHNEYIETRLRESTDDLFMLDNKLILYDLTNTYFESPKTGSRIAKYGKSKEKRNDCPQITLALIVDGMGFPKRSCILEGGVSEPDTLWDLLETLNVHTDSEQHPKTVVIDAGIATEENLKKLREDSRFEYVAISRKKKFEPALEFDSTPRTLRMNRGKELTITTARHDNEVFILCKSPDRTLKDQAIHARRRQRFEKDLTTLNEGLSRPRARNRCSVVYERIGRLKERYKLGHCYDITVHESEGKAVKVSWIYRNDSAKQPGEYLLRTSRVDLADEEVSRVHRSLTIIESAFRWLKSELGLRPNFHQLDKRTISHARISVLAYFMLAPILHRLEWGGEFISTCGKNEHHAPWNVPYGWRGLVRTMSSQTRVTTSFNCKDGTRIDIRTTLEPNTDQLSMYRKLQIDPRPLKKAITKNVVPKKRP